MSIIDLQPFGSLLATCLESLCLTTPGTLSARPSSPLCYSVSVLKSKLFAAYLSPPNRTLNLKFLVLFVSVPEISCHLQCPSMTLVLAGRKSRGMPPLREYRISTPRFSISSSQNTSLDNTTPVKMFKKEYVCLHNVNTRALSIC